MAVGATPELCPHDPWAEVASDKVVSAAASRALMVAEAAEVVSDPEVTAEVVVVVVSVEATEEATEEATAEATVVMVLLAAHHLVQDLTGATATMAHRETEALGVGMNRAEAAHMMTEAAAVSETAAVDTVIVTVADGLEATWNPSVAGKVGIATGTMTDHETTTATANEAMRAAATRILESFAGINPELSGPWLIVKFLT